MRLPEPVYAPPIIAAAIGGIASLVGTAASLFNKPKPPTVPGAPPQPTPIQQPQGQQPQQAATSPSFLAAATQPPQQNTATKTLLGQ